MCAVMLQSIIPLPSGKSEVTLACGKGKCTITIPNDKVRDDVIIRIIRYHDKGHFELLERYVKVLNC